MDADNIYEPLGWIFVRGGICKYLHQLHLLKHCQKIKFTQLFNNIFLKNYTKYFHEHFNQLHPERSEIFYFLIFDSALIVPPHPLGDSNKKQLDRHAYCYCQLISPLCARDLNGRKDRHRNSPFCAENLTISRRDIVIYHNHFRK